MQASFPLNRLNIRALDLLKCWALQNCSSDNCQCFDVLAEQGRTSILVTGEEGPSVEVFDVENKQLIDFLEAHT